MSGRLRTFALISVGAFAGVAVSLGISAYAFRDSRGPIPLEEIRQLTDVFGAIKNHYVEPVEDRKLIQEAISGMLTGLDPHSAFLDADAFRDLQTSTQGEFGGLGIEVAPEDGAVRVVAPIDDTPAYRAGIKLPAKAKSSRSSSSWCATSFARSRCVAGSSSRAMRSSAFRSSRSVPSRTWPSI